MNEVRDIDFAESVFFCLLKHLNSSIKAGKKYFFTETGCIIEKNSVTTLNSHVPILVVNFGLKWTL